MVRGIFCIFISLLFMTGCAQQSEKIEENLTFIETPSQSTTEAKGEFVGVWMPVYEIAPKKNDDADKYTNTVSAMLDSISEFGFTDVFLQVRANCDSIYPSEFFPPCESFCDEGRLRFDALEIFVSQAHKRRLKIHAWLNPYRISSDKKYNKNSSIFSFISDDDINADDCVYIRPSSAKGRRLILDGVREILEKYDVDGIHIDDYFYPTTDKSFDDTDYNRYIDHGGRLSLGDWRRENVNILVSSMYSLIKNFDEEVTFSISPCGDIYKNYHSLYADVETWCGCKGFADMIIPQIYYGFENSSQPFGKCLSRWKDISREVKLVIGLAAYKAGKEDGFAGKGKNEWVDNEDILKRQLEAVRNNSLDGIALFSYNYIFGNSYFKNNEIIALREML